MKFYFCSLLIRRHTYNGCTEHAQAYRYEPYLNIRDMNPSLEA
jgi:hypothetical protein